jgi:hypothetical protein
MSCTCVVFCRRRTRRTSKRAAVLVVSGVMKRVGMGIGGGMRGGSRNVAGDGRVDPKVLCMIGVVEDGGELE